MLDILNKLLASKGYVDRILMLFNSNKELGILAPEPPYEINGNVTPTTGRTLITLPIFINT